MAELVARYARALYDPRRGRKILPKGRHQRGGCDGEDNEGLLIFAFDWVAVFAFSSLRSRTSWPGYRLRAGAARLAQRALLPVGGLRGHGGTAILAC